MDHKVVSKKGCIETCVNMDVLCKFTYVNVRAIEHPVIVRAVERPEFIRAMELLPVSCEYEGNRTSNN